MTPSTGTGGCGLNGVQRQGAGGIAGDDDKLGTLLADEELHALNSVAGDGAAGLGAVGQAGGIAEKGELGLRQAAEQGTQHGKATEAGVEDTDGGRGDPR